MVQVFEFEGYTIFTQVEGEGRPLLLLHSYWGSHVLFDHLAKAFSSKMKVIRIDLPGHGNSAIPPLNYTFEKFAVVLNELLTTLGVCEKITIVGHSMGGYMAMAYAAKYLERIASLVLMHSPVKEADIKSIKLRDREGRLLQNGRKDLLLQVSISSNFAPENLDAMEKALILLTQSSNQVTVEGALRSIYAINHRSSYLGDLKIAHFPILIVIGKYDNVYGAEEQLNDAHQISNAEVLMLQHSGHLGFLEEADLVVEKLSVFLEKEYNIY